MRILVTGFTSNCGGVEMFVMNYYRKIKARHPEFTIDLLCTTQHPFFADEIVAMGGQVYCLPAQRHVFRLKQKTKDFFRANAARYDAVWCNKNALYNIDVIRYAKKYGVGRIVCHSHNSQCMIRGKKGALLTLLHKAHKREISRYVTDFWACSDYAAKWLFHQDVIASDKYCFIPNAVDTAAFQFNEAVRKTYRERLGIGEGTLLIGNVGRFDYQKNHEFLVDVFYKVHQNEENSKLLLIGAGELEEKVKAKVASLGLEDAVCFLGISKEVASWMQAMDCLLLPSRFEGLPVVAVEAQAAGLPVVAARDGITPQTKIIDEFEFLSLSDSAEQWAEEVLRLSRMERRDTASALAANGFEIEQAAQNLYERFQSMENAAV